MDDQKAIYTYPEAYPNRPRPDQLEDGPVEVEFYDLSGRDDEPLPAPIEPTEDELYRFELVALDFIERGETVSDALGGRVDISPDVAHHLEQLGHR